MAKTSKPEIKPASKSKTASKPSAPAAAPRKVNRPKVLIQKTPAELKDLIGADTPIGVSFKELKAIIVAQNSESLLSGL